MYSSRGGFGGFNKEFHGEHRDHEGGGRGGYGYHGGRGRGSHRSRGRGGLGGSDGNQSRFKKSYDEDVRDQVETLYNKKFKFSDEHNQWKLPDSSAWFENDREPFQVEGLLKVKKELNDTKSSLDDVELTSWNRHTHFTNRSGIVIPAVRRDFEPEMCTQGWTKLHEILWTFKNVVPESDLKLNSVHLCEAPGAFVASLNHFLGTHRMDCSWRWKAFTLNPYYEGNSFTSLIDQDKFMSETRENWCVGADDTGDIMTWENFVKFKAEVDKEMEEIHLVTADGSMDCSKNPGEQEAMIAHLIFCEVVAALLLLRQKGNLILKTLTTLEHRTICLMYLLVCCFGEINVFKPATSKSGNSEQYIVCLGYKGHTVLTQKHFEKLKQAYCSSSPMESFFPVKAFPSSFLDQLLNCAKKFAQYQIDAIKENLRFYECMRASEKQFITEVKELTCDTFKTRFKLKKLPRDKNVVQHIYLNGTVLNVMMPVQGDPSREWIMKRSVDDFVQHLEEQKKKQMSLSDGEEDQDEDGVPATKHPRLALSEDACQAVRHLLDMVSYEGSMKVADRSAAELPFVLMEMNLDEVQWLKNNNNTSDVCGNLKSKDGRLFTTVMNSRFCRHDLINKLADTLKKAEIMKPEHADEHLHVASHVTPSHALRVGHSPFYFNDDAVNCAALDNLINFTGKFEEMMFMDLAGAPSGFSHYIYWKKQDLAKGWGMVRVEKPTLGPGKIIEQLAPWETFQVLGPHSGVDISDSVMIKSLCAGIKNYCQDGVHLVIGDVPFVPFGAHPVGYSEFQSKRFLLSQLICACKILCVGGVFICRCYELLSRFSAGLLYVMYKLFDEVSIIKPVTSSPTSPERFIVCRGFNGCKSVLTQLLLDMNSHMTELRKSKELAAKIDILEILPVQQLLEEQFYRYLTLSNERIARYRIKMITFLERFFHNPEKLPSQEEKELLAKGILEVLQLPQNPF